MAAPETSSFSHMFETHAQVAEIQAAALAEDASVFDYDAHYDAIQESRDQPKRQEKLQRHSRYIESLLGAKLC